MHHRKQNLIRLLVVVSAMAVFTGCAAWKKKFIRQKKTAEAERIEPILVPEDYPEFTVTPTRLYRLHYDMWKVWARELETALADRASVKRLNHIQQKLRRHAVVLEGLVQEKWRPHWSAIIERLDALAEQWNRPTGFQPYLIKQEIRRLDTKVRETLAPRFVEGHLVEIVPPELEELL